MAFDKVVDSTFLEAGLKKVGDSIRAKVGTSELLEFPDAMSTAVDAIDTSEDLDEVLDEQESIIDAIQLALEGKAAGGINEDDITAELLQELDPDFKAENIAEGVNMFGLIGTFAGGFQVIEGTVTAAGGASLTITGIPFEPKYMVIMSETDNSATRFYKSENAYFYFYLNQTTKYYVPGSSLEEYSNNTWKTTLYAGAAGFPANHQYRYLFVG